MTTIKYFKKQKNKNFSHLIKNKIFLNKNRIIYLVFLLQIYNYKLRS